jgi:uncharacterized protein YbaR (Trm112 family)
MESLPCPRWLVGYLRCPISHSELLIPSPRWFAKLAESHAATPLATRLGRSISQLPMQGLLSHDRHWLYIAENQIPTLIPDEAIVVPESLRDENL